MTEILLVIFLGTVLLFTGIVFYGAPYVPTKREQIHAALDLLALKPGQTLIELGSGDGRVAREAARRGILVVGYELNPILVLVSIYTTRQYRGLVTIHWRNYLHATWPPAEGVFIFGGGPYMKRVYKKIRQTNRDMKVASFAFTLPLQTYSKEEKGIFLYELSGND